MKIYVAIEDVLKGASEMAQRLSLLLPIPHAA